MARFLNIRGILDRTGCVDVGDGMFCVCVVVGSLAPCIVGAISGDIDVEMFCDESADGIDWSPSFRTAGGIGGAAAIGGAGVIGGVV